MFLRVASPLSHLLSRSMSRRRHAQLAIILMLGCWVPTAQAVVPLTGVTAITAGEQHTCAVANRGVKCWGWNNYGQLGHSAAWLSRPIAMDVIGLPTPVAAVTAGNGHTCALTSWGAARCWGHNPWGQLGDGTSESSVTPVPVFGLISGVTAIAADNEDTLAIVSGAAMGWGYGSYFRLGASALYKNTAPIPVTDLFAGVTAVAPNYYHTCVVQNGGAKCVGDNTFAALGNTAIAHTSSVPVDVDGLTVGVRKVVAGRFHSCALMVGGAVKCWGSQPYGALGNDSDATARSPVNVTGLPGAVAAITAGYGHNCALLQDGAVWCWGQNDYSQLGNGSTIHEHRPVPVDGLPGPVMQVAAGYYHTCALLTTGSVKCWGRDTYGQLGDNSTATYRLSPVDVQTESNGSVPPLFVSFGLPTSAAPAGRYAEPVNTATGNYYYQNTDLRVPGRGLGFAFTRSYNSLSSYIGPLGIGWTHSYNLSLLENASDGSVVVTHGDGRQSYFDSAGGGNYVSRYPGAHDRLVKGTDFTLTAKDQTQYRFSLAGVLTSITDPNGNALQLAHGGGRLTGITDTVGRLVTLAYNTDGRIASVTDPAARTASFSYDGNGNLATSVDPRGFVTTYSYDDLHRLTKIVDRRGNTLLLNVYDVAGRVISQTNGRGFTTGFAYDTPAVGDTTITNPLGHVALHTHDAQYRLLVERDGLGHEIEYTYDANNNRIEFEDKNDKITTFTYDDRGNVTSATDPLGNVTTIAYDARDNPTQRTGPDGKTFQFAYDGSGNLTSITDPLAGITQIAYDANGQSVSLTNARGKTWTRTYDAFGNLTEVTDPLNAVTQFAYDTAARLTSRTDASGHTTGFNYDAADNLLAVIAPLGQTTTFTYDGNGNRTSITDARGTTTHFVYDQNDLLVQAIDGLGGIVDFAYDGADRRTAVMDPRDNTTSFAYDAAGRMVGRTDALGQVTQFAYDGNGNLVTLTNPMGKTTHFAYDALNRQIGMTDALGNLTQGAYDAMGRLATVTDANGRVTTYAHDALGHLVKVIDPAGGTATYGYDAVGNRIQVNDPKNMGVTYAYTAINRLQTRAAPLGDIYTYNYDAVGRRISRTDAKAATTAYDYDANGRLASIAYPDLSMVTFGYDAVGNRMTMNDSLGTTSYEYDVLNRITRTTDPFGNVVSYTYDAAGNRKTVGYPGAKQVTYAYDELNRMKAVSDWLGGTTQYVYDAAGNLETAALPNGATADYFYDDARRLKTLVNARPDTSFIAGYLLDLDRVGNRVQITPQGPLAPVMSDATNGYTYDALNRLVTLNGSPATSDANGNQTTLPGVTYAYDVEDRLISVAGGLTQYRYDGAGNRREATRSGATTRYVLDVAGAMSNVLMETDSSGSPTAYYVHGLGLTSRIAPSGDARYYHYDPVGNTVALTDAAASVTDQYAYDPFGVPSGQQGATANPFRYVGQYGVMEESAGLVFMRSRYYNPQLARFIGPDRYPAAYGETQPLNRFAYAENDPLNQMDPLGLFSWKTLGVGLLQMGYAFLVNTAAATSTAAALGTGGGAVFVQGVASFGSINDASKWAIAAGANIRRAFNDQEPISHDDVPGFFDRLAAVCDTKFCNSIEGLAATSVEVAGYASVVTSAAGLNKSFSTMNRWHVGHFARLTDKNQFRIFEAVVNLVSTPSDVIQAVSSIPRSRLGRWSFLVGLANGHADRETLSWFVDQIGDALGVLGATPSSPMPTPDSDLFKK